MAAKISRKDFNKAMEVLDAVDSVKRDIDKQNVKIHQHQEEQKAINKLVKSFVDPNTQIEQMDIEQFYKDAFSPFEARGIDLDNLTPMDIINHEFKAVRMSKNSNGYKILSYILTNFRKTNDKPPSLDEVYEGLTKKFNKSREEINKYLTIMIKRYDFDNTLFLIMLRDIKEREPITPELFLTEWLDYLL